MQNIPHILDIYLLPTELSECHAQLPAFIDTHHTVSHCLSPRGVSACERVISVIAFSHPAITYAPSLYSLTSVLLHYMDGKFFVFIYDSNCFNFVRCEILFSGEISIHRICSLDKTILVCRNRCVQLHVCVGFWFPEQIHHTDQSVP